MGKCVALLGHMNIGLIDLLNSMGKCVGLLGHMKPMRIERLV